MDNEASCAALELRRGEGLQMTADFGNRLQFLESGLCIVPQLLPGAGVLDSSWREYLESGKLRRVGGRFVVGTLPPALAHMSFHPLIIEYVQYFLRRNDVALYYSRLLLKDSQWAGAVELHQDMPYFSGGQHKLSVFVPLAQMRASDGGLCFVPGSHKFGQLERGVIRREAFYSEVASAAGDIRPDLGTRRCRVYGFPDMALLGRGFERAARHANHLSAIDRWKLL